MSFANSYALALKESFVSKVLSPSGLDGKADSLKATSTEQKNNFVDLVEKLNILNKVFQEEQDINLFFLSPAIPVTAKKQALKKVFESVSYKGLICSFLYLLLDKKKWSEWPAILNHLNHMKEESQGFMLVEVKSALALSKDLKEKLIQKLSQFFKKQVRLQTSIDPHLIGGMQIRAKGFVFDDSLSYHLKRMGRM